MGSGLKSAAAMRDISAIRRFCRILFGISLVFSIFLLPVQSFAIEGIAGDFGRLSVSALQFDAEDYANFAWRGDSVRKPSGGACRYALESAQIDGAKKKVFEPVIYTFVVTLDKSCQLLPLPPKHDAITCAPPTVQTVIADPSTLRHTVTVACQYARPGVFYTTPFQAGVSDSLGSSVGQYYPGNMRVGIEAFDPDFIPSAPIETTLPLMAWQTTIVQEILIGLVAALAVFAAVFAAISRKRPKDAAPRPFKAHLKPIETFHARIAELIDIAPNTAEENKALYDRLSQAMRELIEALFEFETFNRTTHQIIGQLRIKCVGNDLCSEVMRILLEADRVKFTVSSPGCASAVVLMRDMSSCGVRLDETAAALKNEAEQKRLQQIQEASNNSKENPSDACDSASGSAPANAAEAAPATPGDARDHIDKNDPMRFAPPELSAITPRTPPEEAFIIDLSLPDNTGWTPNPHSPAGAGLFSDSAGATSDGFGIIEHGGEE